MGSQGNYPGSGQINQHKHLAMRGEVASPAQNVDSHLKEGKGGNSSGIVGAVNMEPVHEIDSSEHRLDNVR